MMGGVPIRTFVTSVQGGLGATLLANYHRSEVRQAETGHAEQSHKSEDIPQITTDCSVGQAATATACFKPFFGSYHISSGYHIHVGGAEKFACPAEVTLREAQSLWPNMLNGRPHLLISVGCGHEISKTSAFSAGCISAEAMWKRDFKARTQKEPGVYIRLCPEFPKNTLPEADDLSFLLWDSLPSSGSASSQDYQEKIINRDDIRTRIDQIAQRLISTIFYAEQSTTRFPNQTSRIVSGMLPLNLPRITSRAHTNPSAGCIRCRYKETSALTKAFGGRLASLKNPRFVSGDEILWTFDPISLRAMEEQGRFRAPFEITLKSEDDLRIKFTADDFAAQSISGNSLSRELSPVDV
jgi:hypothetical protein